VIPQIHRQVCLLWKEYYTILSKFNFNKFSPLALPILTENECLYYKTFYRAEENIVP
jgi:hypothetical protein